MKAGKKVVFSLVVMALAVLTLGITATSVLAKGTFAKITVSGGGLTSEIEATDPALLGFGSLSAFPTALKQAPPVTGEGYLITRYEQDSNGHYIAWDRLRYYPSVINTGGYVFYEGLINGSSEYDGHWFNAVPSGEAAIQAIVNTQNTPSSLAQYSLLLLGLGLGVIATVAIVVQIRAPKKA